MNSLQICRHFNNDYMNDRLCLNRVAHYTQRSYFDQINLFDCIALWMSEVTKMCIKKSHNNQYALFY